MFRWGCDVVVRLENVRFFWFCYLRNNNICITTYQDNKFDVHRFARRPRSVCWGKRGKKLKFNFLKNFSLYPKTAMGRGLCLKRIERNKKLNWKPRTCLKLNLILIFRIHCSPPRACWQLMMMFFITALSYALN